MPWVEVRARGLESVALATDLLRRARRADPYGGPWDAADVQWWWRTPRRSDVVEQVFWTDADGPVAAVLLTDFRGTWQCDLIVAPDAARRQLQVVWARMADVIAALRPDPVEVPTRDDDLELIGLLQRAGFTPAERSPTGWMSAGDRPVVAGVPDGFVVVDRVGEATKPHPMRGRNGEEVEARLRDCSLYDPRLDLAVETTDGDVAGYALFWFDPVTEVGLVEPMRVEDAYQRRGLARALLTTGIDRLAALGARRVKVGWTTTEAGALYQGSGFRRESELIWYAAAGSEALDHPHESSDSGH